MATFTITASNTNIDTLSGKTGGDVYNVNGGQPRSLPDAGLAAVDHR